jgi:hypothetical protein
VRRWGVADICAPTPDFRSNSHPHRLLAVLSSGVLGAAWYSLSALELSCGVPVNLMLLALSEYERLWATAPYVGGRPTHAMRITASQFDSPVADTMLIVPRSGGRPRHVRPERKGLTNE